MKVTLILADSAQAIGNKLYILGGGWSITSPGVPFAIAVKIEVPWSQGAEQHTFRLALLDADGQPVLVAGDGEEERPIFVEGGFSTGIPAGLKAGTPLDTTMAFSFPHGLPLRPGERYEWRLTIDGRTEDGWQLGFSTRPAPAQ